MLPIPPLLLGVLQSRTLWYALGILSVVSVIFVGGCNYGARGKAELQAEFDNYKQTQALIVKRIQDEAKQNAIAANQKLKNQERVNEESYKRHSNELKKLRKELDSIRIHAELVSLLNDSARGGKDQPTTGPDIGKDGAVDEKANAPNASEGTVTLGDLAETILINNKNHLACVQQVEAWQEFYMNLYNQFEYESR